MRERRSEDLAVGGGRVLSGRPKHIIVRSCCGSKREKTYMSDNLFLCLEREIEKIHFAFWSAVRHRHTLGAPGGLWNV